MRRAALLAGVVLLIAAGFARAEDDPVTPASGFGRRTATDPLCCPPCAPVPGSPIYPPGSYPTPPGTPGMPPDQPPVAPPPGMPDDLANRLATPFATGTGGGGLQGRTFNEQIDGDMAGVFYRQTAIVGVTTQRVVVGTTQRTIITNGSIPTVITVPVFGNVTVPATRSVLVPVPGRYSGTLITDNDSARPTDRVYFDYSYYDGIGASLNPGFGNITQNREMIGIEKVVLDGNASIGLRLPFVQVNTPGSGVGGDSVGDLSVLVKYALINNRDNGNVLSVGLVVTTPTGPAGGLLSDGSSVPHSVLFQPWVGFVRTFNRGYVQGISSVIVPTDGRDVTLLGNSIAAGYWLYSGNPDRLIPGITPIVEIHVRTPLNDRDPNGLVYLPDQVNITGGLHFRWNRTILSGGVNIPVVGPRPWNAEAIANLNFRF